MLFAPLGRRFSHQQPFVDAFVTQHVIDSRFQKSQIHTRLELGFADPSSSPTTQKCADRAHSLRGRLRRGDAKPLERRAPHRHVPLAAYVVGGKPELLDANLAVKGVLLQRAFEMEKKKKNMKNTKRIKTGKKDVEGVKVSLTWWIKGVRFFG